jgi:predicted enzyme related to lactoylglutathione lyase
MEAGGFQCRHCFLPDERLFAEYLDTEQEVTALYEEFVAKGVTILKEPTAPLFGGLFFYFQDVEGNILEVACNSYVLLDDVKNAVGHKPIDDL